MPDRDTQGFPAAIHRYLDRLYAEQHRRWACGGRTPEEITRWQEKARPALHSLLGLDLIREQAGDHRPSVTGGPPEELDGFSRQLCAIETEPEVRVPFWLLKPNHPGRFPLALTPHGHDADGADAAAGVVHDAEHARGIREEDRDVAVQAVRHGFLAVAPATRGLGHGFVADVFDRFGGVHCVSHYMHGLLAGRTSIGERVWDMQRLLDWATQRDDVDPRHVLMMGNSGGGVLTTFAAACDPRIGIAVSSCAYSSLVGLNGKIQHHQCNAVPGIMRFGEFWDVAALIIPRHFLAVHGRVDPLKANDEVDRATRELRKIYGAAGVAGRFEQHYGDGGHRFYKELMWPFIRKALGK